MNNPLVSIIISTKNSSRTLEACLKSIKEQSYKNIEIIVVDNNSTDNTKEIALKYTDRVFNQGPERSAQRNYGAKQAKGEFLLIHDSDIYFNIDSVKECVELIEKENCDAIILPEKSIGIGFWSKVKAFERSFYVGNDLIEAPRFFKRDVFENMRGYDEDLTGPEDWDLGIRLIKANYKISRTKKILLHDEGEVDLFGSSKKKQYYANDVFDKYSGKHPEEFKKQMSFFFRFPLSKIIKKGLRHPILFIFMVFMKGLEYINSKKKIFIDVITEEEIINISVGIPIYNEEKNIKNLLLSLKKQVKVVFDEIILFDDGSKDNTAVVIQDIVDNDKWMKEKVRFIKATHNSGKSAGLRKIFLENNSLLLVLIDSDMVLEDDCVIFKLASPFKSNKKLGMTSGWLYFEKGRKPLQHVFEFSSELLKQIGKYKPIYSCSGCLMCIKKENISKIEIPPSLTRIDAFLYMITIKNGFTYLFCREAQVLDKKDFNNLTLSWYIRAQNRVGSFPQVFMSSFANDFFNMTIKMSFLLRIFSFVVVFIRRPINGIYYIFFKLIAIIKNKIINKKNTDYLWRK